MVELAYIKTGQKGQVLSSDGLDFISHGMKWLNDRLKWLAVFMHVCNVERTARQTPVHSKAVLLIEGDVDIVEIQAKGRTTVVEANSINNRAKRFRVRLELEK